MPKEFAAIVLGNPDGNRRLALGIGLAGLFAILVFHVVITWFSLRYRRRTQRLLGFMVDPFEQVISRAVHLPPALRPQRHLALPPGQRLPARRRGVPGAWPPTDFRDYRLSVGGLVAHPMNLSLAELRGARGPAGQITKHNCIQGWTAIAEWAGVPLARLIEEVRPARSARHVVFYAMDDKGLTEGEGRYGFFYGTIPIHLATNPQTILALDMNGAPLPVEHGAPVRLRIETQLGFKMVKWIAGIEFVADVKDIGMGMGGWREDQQFYANAAGI